MGYSKDTVEKMSSAEYVEYLEKLYPFPMSTLELYKDRPHDVIAFLMEAVSLGITKDDAVNTLASAPSGLADIFKQKLRAIEKTLPMDAASAISDIPITCIPTLRSPNAESAITPRGDPYIVVDVGLSICLHSMTKAFFHCVNLPPGEASDVPLSKKEVLEFLHKMALYFKSGDVSKMPRIRSRKSTFVTMFQTEIDHALQVFVIWHELAHYLLGHVPHSLKAVTIETSPPLEVRLVSRARKEEFHADYIGAGFAYNTFEFYNDREKAREAQIPPTISPEIYAAPDIFFTFLDTLEKLCGETWSDNHTHPAASSRRAVIRQQYNKQLPDQATQFGQAVEEVFLNLLL
jgi:hypothetical protein